MQWTRLGRLLCQLSRRSIFFGRCTFLADLTSVGTAGNSRGAASILAVPSSPEAVRTEDFCQKRDAAG